MKTKRRICLYGNSLILGTIGTGLRLLPQYEVIPLSSKVPKVKELMDIAPDAVLFDLEATDVEDVLSWLSSRPNLLLIGISPSDNVVRLWSGKQLRQLAIRDLINIIDGNFERTESP
jgi:hypothetical protein